MDIKPVDDWQKFHHVGRSLAEKNNFQIPHDQIPISKFGLQDYGLWVSEEIDLKGRVAAFIHPDFDKGFIGWFESDPNEELAHTLLQKALQWLKSRGVNEVIGPVNGNIWGDYRFNVSGEHPLFVGEIAQPQFYPETWKSFGFKPYDNYYTKIFKVDDLEGVPWEKINGMLAQQGFTLKTTSREVFDHYKEKIYDLVIRCFSYANHPLFSPISYEEFLMRYDSIPETVPEEFSLLLINKKDDPIGFFLNYPSPYLPDAKNGDQSYKTIVAKTWVVDPSFVGPRVAYSWPKLPPSLAKKLNMAYQVNAFMHEDNHSLKFFKKERTHALRHYQLFSYKLN